MRPFVIARDIFLIVLSILLILAWKGYISWWWAAPLLLSYLSLLLLSAVNIRWNFFVTSLHHGSRDRKLIALSFDDGPAAYTEDILDILKAEGVAAAFFCIGKNAAAAEDVVRRWNEEGHLIGNHSYDHATNFDWKNRDQMAAELLRTNRLITSITGNTPKLFRPPYGVTNPALSQAISLTGMTSVGWSLRSFDTTAKTGTGLLERLNSKLRNGDIVLLHDSMPTTASILTAFIRDCREKGYTFVRLDELLGVEAYA